MSQIGLLAGASLTVLVLATPASAQMVDEVIVTGSRAAPRTALESAVPVDSFSAAEIEAVSHSDTMDLLKTLVPSYSLAREPISDGATFIRPAALRGLPSDKTLLLVNSKRRHRSALVLTGGSGTQSQDAAQIPSSALKAVEVLRDGAGAQYGSDAIAGVINFILKDDSDGGSLSIQAGQYYEGDGDAIVIGGNKGFALGDNGFINVSFEYVTEQPTSRGRQYCNRNLPNQNAGFCVGLFPTETTAPGSAYTAAYAQSVNYGGLFTKVAQKWGQPDAEGTRIFVNAGYDITPEVQIYAFANYSRSNAKEDFNYRNPVDVGATTNQSDDFVYTRAGNLFRANMIFPLGFTPQFFGTVVDYSFVSGIKGEIWGGLGYDLSARYGNDNLSYDMNDTVNFSLGEASPTKFHVGALESDEVALNADMTYAWTTGFSANPVAIAFGAEYRKEGYEILKGDVGSYIAGPYATQDPYDFCTNEPLVVNRTLRATAPQNKGIVCNAATVSIDGRTFNNPVYTALGVGSNGAPGFPPLYSGRLTRKSKAAYVDLSTDLTEQLFVQASLRAEDFSDFGSTLDYKVAARFEFNDAFAVRGSIGTGFRAPTTGQLFTTYTSTVVNNGVPVAQGLFPATNPVSVFLGADEIGPEESTNYSVGVTAQILDGLTLTFDAYYIEIKDMFYAITPINVTPAITAAMVSAGIPGAESIGQVSFFQNAFDAKVQGFDAVATYTLGWENGQSTALSASMNWNLPLVDKVKKAGFFDGEYVFDFKHREPRWRSVMTATHTAGPFTLLGRASVYGPYKNMFSVGNPVVQKFKAEVFLDLEASYDVTDYATIALGVRNVLDNYPEPDRIGESATNGRIYRSDSVVDWQGGFYYAKLAMTF
ncbi:TonB-dependent receptor domain-containing protein [Phenylobacterium sp.]|uniref:TonB-dependent receptor plug domain-containing protein n=1 Tax=Phenylobacterium sp. TaxID=1871053 RepID=UPI00286C768F|nr:TonB-dependent receptor [Phenylobacterium sp.]